MENQHLLCAIMFFRLYRVYKMPWAVLVKHWKNKVHLKGCRVSVIARFHGNCLDSLIYHWGDTDLNCSGCLFPSSLHTACAGQQLGAELPVIGVAHLLLPVRPHKGCVTMTEKGSQNSCGQCCPSHR